MVLVEEIVKKHGRKRENLLPILQDIVKSDSYLSEESMINVAKELNISSAEVYGIASFYSFLETKPMGKNIIRICRTISCDMKDKDQIIKAIGDKLRIKLGETTPDKKFTFLETNCIGWCHKGPAMLVNDEVYTELTPVKAVEVLDKYLQD